ELVRHPTCCINQHPRVLLEHRGNDLGDPCLASKKSAGTFPVINGRLASWPLAVYSHFPPGCASVIFPLVSYCFAISKLSAAFFASLLSRMLWCISAARVTVSR